MADDKYRDYDRRSDYRTEERPERSQSIFSDDNDRSRWGGGDRSDGERGFIEKAGDEIRSWFGDDDPRRDRDRGDHDRSLHSGGMSARGYGYDRPLFGGRADRGGTSGRPANRHDDHYRQWRDRQIAEFDRDYEEYCRERQDRFDQDFASWRRERRQEQSSATPSEGRGATTGASRLKDKARSGAPSGPSGSTGTGETATAGAATGSGRSRSKA